MVLAEMSLIHQKSRGHLYKNNSIDKVFFWYNQATRADLCINNQLLGVKHLTKESLTNFPTDSKIHTMAFGISFVRH